ncbi:MAG: hypothetical protein HKN74_13795 [Acidimicrobiia bacterium]|nr:hypothetical protein [Acidimicrobiia bacterium]NNF11347.1 hypothetical protein [Acidimicrobiia bacterium]NNL69408.1 hypothetical protein [Acidimicrobiia bacterium]
MSEFRIDTDRGPDAAADLADAELEYLCGLTLWELAVRTDEPDFADYLHRVLDMRRERAAELESVRDHRDRMLFAAEVMRDLAALPTTGS